MTAQYVPQPGDVVWLSFSPQAGREQQGDRPGLVISQRAFHRQTGFAWICPITSRSKGYPFEVPLPDTLTTKGVVLVDQARSLDFRARNIRYIETAPSELLHRVLLLVAAILAPRPSLPSEG